MHTLVGIAFVIGRKSLISLLFTTVSNYILLSITSHETFFFLSIATCFLVFVVELFCSLVMGYGFLVLVLVFVLSFPQPASDTTEH